MTNEKPEKTNKTKSSAQKTAKKTPAKSTRVAKAATTTSKTPRKATKSTAASKAKTKPAETKVTSEAKTQTQKGIKIKVKTLLTVIVLVALGVVGYIYKGQFVVATVNGQPICRWKLIKELEDQYGQQVLQGLITEKMISQEAEELGVVVTDEEIDAEIKKIKDEFLAQGSSLEAALAMQGLTLEDVKEGMRPQLIMTKIIEASVEVTDGDVVSLPEGATSIDFAYSLHTDIGNTAITAEANGEKMAMHEPLRSGDVVYIRTDKKKKYPDPMWLDYAKTKKARIEIKKGIVRKTKATVANVTK